MTAHRLLATLTLGLVGAGLLALAVLVPVGGVGAELEDTVSRVVQRP